MEERLQKLLARAGLGSRRSSEELITAGRVRVNGRIVTELGSRADPRRDRIEIDGKRVVLEAPVFILLHKPRSVVSTMSDPEGRPTVADFVRSLPVRVFPVGRLDFQSSGALLLTNDGEFAAHVLHPRHHVPKTYLVKVEGDMKPEDVDRWRQGIMLEDGVTLPAEAWVTQRAPGYTWIELVLREGRNQQIRRMGEATGFPVVRLTRTAFGGISIDRMRAGQWRLLSLQELRDLKENYGVPNNIRAVIAAHAELAPHQPVRGLSAKRAADRDAFAGGDTSPKPDQDHPRREQAGVRTSSTRPQDRGRSQVGRRVQDQGERRADRKQQQGETRPTRQPRTAGRHGDNVDRDESWRQTKARRQDQAKPAPATRGRSKQEDNPRKSPAPRRPSSRRAPTRKP